MNKVNKVEETRVQILIEEALKDMSPQYQKALRYRYGLDDNRTKSLAETSKHFNIRKCYIRQIEAKMLRRMRNLKDS